jgi:hypothetical protein
MALGIVGLGVALLQQTRASTGADRGWALTIDAVASPAGNASSAPQLTSTGDAALVSWIERTPSTVLKFAERTMSGWSPAKTIVTGNDLVVNAADVPSVRALADGTLAAAWMVANGPDPEGYDLRLAFSKDHGATWSKPVTPHHDRTETQHGFASLFQSSRGGLGLVWLDGRANNPKLAHPSDTMSLRAAMFSRAGAQVSETAIDTRVCDCCPTSVAVTSDGPVVAYRDRSAQEIRDIAVSRLVAGRWTPPAIIHKDGWRIDACPINGPSISAHDRELAVAWFTAVNGAGKAYVAFSHDGAKTFGEPIRVDDESTSGKVDVALLPDGAAIVSWIEFANERSQFKVRRIGANGERSAAILVAGAGEGRVAGNPRFALRGNELVFAWTETSSGASNVRTARAALP